MSKYFNIFISVFCTCYIVTAQAQVELDNPNSINETPLSRASNIFSGFTLHPGIGTAFIDVSITKRSNQYEADLTDSLDSIGAPFLTFSILSPKYYFSDKLSDANNDFNALSGWSIGVRSETHTINLSHQALAQNANFEPQNIGTSVDGIMSFVALMLYKDIASTTDSGIVTFGLGYTKGFVDINGTAIFGPGRNTTGITTKEIISGSSSTATGVTLLIEADIGKGLLGFELALLNFENALYEYQISGARFYLSYPYEL